MSEHLYPTLVADGSLSTPIADNCSTLQNQITSEIDKYLQEAVERHERDDNYFIGWHMATNTSSLQQEANFIEQDDEDDEVRGPESNGQDTGEYGTNPTEHDIQYQDKLETIPVEEEEDPQMAEKQDVDDPDTVVYTPDDSEEEESKYGVLGTTMMWWLLGGTMVVVPQNLSCDLWAWLRRSHETCHVTCGHGLRGPTRPVT